MRKKKVFPDLPILHPDRDLPVKVGIVVLKGQTAACLKLVPHAVVDHSFNDMYDEIQLEGYDLKKIVKDYKKLLCIRPDAGCMICNEPEDFDLFSYLQQMGRDFNNNRAL